MCAGLFFLLFFGRVSASAAAEDGWGRQLESGRALAGQGRYHEALAALERARGRAAEAGSSEGQALALNDLGAIYMQLHDLSAAERCLRRSAEIWGPRGDQHALAPRINLAGVYIGRRQYRAAETLLKDAEGLAERDLGPDHPVTGQILLTLAKVAFDLHDGQRAEALCSQALHILRQNGSANDVALVLESLGAIYFSQRKVDDAARLFAESAEIVQTLHGSDHPALILTIEDSGRIEFARGHYPEAQERLQRALTLAEKTLGPEHPTVGRLLREYASVLRTTGRRSEARRLADRAARIERQSARDDGAAYIVDFRMLPGLH